MKYVFLFLARFQNNDDMIDVDHEIESRKEVPVDAIKVIKRDRDARVGGRIDDSGGCSKVSWGDEGRQRGRLWILESGRFAPFRGG